ncbi:MAG TPA: hypothetical protein VFD33_03420 [Bacillota bacterium]|nr:hypothetical protein [Bacillota bacterium]
MIYPYLKKWAEDNGWTMGKSRIHGEYKGYPFTAFDGKNTKYFITSLPILSESQEQGILEDLEGNKDLLNISDYSINDNLLKVVFTEVTTPMDQDEIRTYLEHITAVFDRLDIKVAGHCFSCQEEVYTEKTLVDDHLVLMCSECYGQVNNAYELAMSEHETEDKKYGRGFLGAFLGALLGSLGWGVLSYYGWKLVYLFAFFTAFASLLGYKKLGGKMGKLTPLFVMGSTVLCILLAELIANMTGVYLALNDISMEINGARLPFSFARDFEVLIELIADPEMGIRSTITTKLSVSLVLAFLGMAAIFRDMKKDISMSALKATKI